MLDEITITSLGSGSTIPSSRPLASAHVKIRGEEYLIDVPEGTQRQLFELGLGLTIDTIFITNTAERSLLGLPGLLNTFSFFGNRTKPLTIYCPPGAIHEVRDVIDWFEINSYDVSIKEIIPSNFSLDKEDYQIKTVDNEREGSFGLTFIETEVRGEFDREKAEELGVPPGPKYGKLCNGEPVDAKDGSTVKPEQVLRSPPDTMQVVFSGRTPPSESITRAAQNADALIHDAALIEDYDELKGRSSISDAVDTAEDSNAKVLLLFRILARIGHYPDSKFERRAEDAANSPISVSTLSYGTQVAIRKSGVEVTSVK